jgi:2-oxoglutarate ferredoxin oxidoreductase subunit beta
MHTESSSLPVLTAKDFSADQDVRWCPGCGDYSILAQVKKVLPTLGLPREKFVFVSGIGCASRFPYYVESYGFHGIHGRAPAIATGVKTANPELSVWVATGDGDGLSIGGNHLIHAMRRNVGLKILLFNNRIYGLTKGQYSPTSELGKRTKSSPMGTVDMPLNPVSLALGAECTFVARTLDVDVKHLVDVLTAAAHHEGTAFVEIYQDCNVFNHMAFEYVSDKSQRSDHALYLEHGKPLIFGKNRDKGIRLNGLEPEVVPLGSGITEDDLLFHDQHAEEPTLAHLLGRMNHPAFPVPMGVFRQVRHPTFEQRVQHQIDEAAKTLGRKSLAEIYDDGETWLVA